MNAQPADARSLAPRRQILRLRGAGVALIVCLSLLVQAVLFWDYFDNNVLNAFSPTSYDAVDYFKRATTWRTEGFAAALGDAYRMPGYPAFLALCQLLFGDSAPLGARLIQAIAIASSAGFLFLAAAKYVSRVFALIIGVVASLYVPISYFSPLLYAEALTVLAVSVLMFLLSRLHESAWWTWIGLGAALAVLTYLKPNSILMLAPVLVFASAALKVRRLVSCMVIIGVCCVSLLPWTLFASSSQGRFVPLTTTSGVNLYLGLGVGGTTGGGSLDRVGAFLGVDEDPNKPAGPGSGRSAAEESSYWTDEAVRVWMDRPVSQAGYSVAKALYTFGLLPRGIRDVALGLVTIAGLVSAIALWRDKRLRPWGIMFAVLAATVALQAAAYLPNQRFRVALFDAPAILVIGLAVPRLFPLAWLQAQVVPSQGSPAASLNSPSAVNTGNG